MDIYYIHGVHLAYMAERRYSMAQQRFVVTEGDHKVGNSVAWRYTATGEGITFYNQSIPEHVVKVDGNFINKDVAFVCRGELSTFLGEVVQPKDPRAQIMWYYGFTKATRVRPHEVVVLCKNDWDMVVDRHCGYDPESNYGCNDKGDFILSHDIISTVVKTESGKILVATAFGRIYGSNEYIRISYLDKSATKEHVGHWRDMFLSTTKGVTI